MTTETDNLVADKPVDDASATLKKRARRAYNIHQKDTIDSDLIVQFLPMVHKIVQRVVTYIKPPLSYEDLVAAGSVGLIKAARDFNPSLQAEFKTYAYIRIKGSVLDELRNFSLLSPTADKEVKEVSQTTLEMTNQNGKVPSDQELADKLQISVDKLYQTFENARTKNFVSIDTITENSTTLGASLIASDTPSPSQQLEQSELIEKLTEAIQQLSERQRQIIILYYQKELTMKQIAEVFNITEPRVSQLHASALFNLSVKMRKLRDG
ncbi:MAG: FliA/WhiG family RNA polymerase sigma factor [Phycisphaerales bacterium]